MVGSPILSGYSDDKPPDANHLTLFSASDFFPLELGKKEAPKMLALNFKKYRN